MKEASYYARIGAYYLKHPPTTVWEAKITKSNTLPFSCLAIHQEQALLAAKKVLAWKLPDNGRMKKPADGIVIHKAKAVIVAIYYAPRDTEIYEIDIWDWVNETYGGEKKSLSKECAASIGKRIYL